MRHYLVTLLIVAASVMFPVVPGHAGDFTFVLAPPASIMRRSVRLPACPPGCKVRLFYFPPRFTGDYKHKRGWHTFLYSNGMIFPKGGFVVYQPATGACVIASTDDDLDLIEPLN